MGTLIEADFEKLTAQLRSATGRRVSVSFPVHLSDEIHAALRHESNLEGRVRYAEGEAIGLELVRIARSYQPALGDDFWVHLNTAQLAKIQGIEIPTSVSAAFEQIDASDEEADAFIGALER